MIKREEIRLSAYAKLKGKTYRTYWNYYRAGKLPTAYMTDSGTIMVVIEDDTIIEERVVIYARVSSNDQKQQLETQIDRLRNYCAIKGYQIHKEYKEIGSGLNDKRPIFNKMLDEEKITRIIVEHKDRLTRFGFSFLEKLLLKQNIIVEVINLTENDKTDLIEDFVNVITSFCARIYGQRRSKRRVLEIVKDLSIEDAYNINK